jgi:hypothetical protein
MWIVDVRLYPTRSPAKSRMTHCAKHLVASFQFVNTGSAGGTRFRVRRQKFGSRQCRCVAFVRTVPCETLDFVAFATRPFLTYPAFPALAQKSTTFAVGAGSDKYGTLGLGSAICRQLISLASQALETSIYLAQFLHFYASDFLFQFLALKLMFYEWLRCWHQGTLLVEQHRFPMSFIVRIHKRFGK